MPEHRIRTGYYGFDHDAFAAVAPQREAAADWPRQFLFVGRYVPEKDLQTLTTAYQRYRAGVAKPWGLTCCGSGPDAGLLQRVPGITDMGFTTPKELPRVFRDHGCFVLPSRFEPWGVVIAEAAASGLPVICSEACGAGQDLVTNQGSGVVVPNRDPASLARAMRWVHDHAPELPAMGKRGQELASAYSAAEWARRWHTYCLELIETPIARVA